MGCCRLVAVRAPPGRRNPRGDRPSLSRDEQRNGLQVQLQSHIQRLEVAIERLDLAGPLRDRPGSRRADDRELPLGAHMAPHAWLPLSRTRAASRWISRWLAEFLSRKLEAVGA